MNFLNITDDSAIKKFYIKNDSVTVWFGGVSHPYTYTCASAGEHHISVMKELARKGNGLHKYIQSNVKHRFVH